MFIRGCREISFRYKFVSKAKLGAGFTLIELLVVLGIISVLMGILLPALTKVRYRLKTIVNQNNQRQIVSAVTLYSEDNNNRYPESVATSGLRTSWNWSDPKRMITPHMRSGQSHRAMSEYLGRYIDDSSIMFCPNAPRKYRYFQAAWDAGDEWNNPETPVPYDALGGTYCFYWNYVGLLEGRSDFFQGPRTNMGGRKESKLLMCDYFGYDSYRRNASYCSCERLKGASVISETFLLPSFWFLMGEDDSSSRANLSIRLNAAYIDGHVEEFGASDVVVMRVLNRLNGATQKIHGSFFLPSKSLR